MAGRLPRKIGTETKRETDGTAGFLDWTSPSGYNVGACDHASPRSHADVSAVECHNSIIPDEHIFQVNPHIPNPVRYGSNFSFPDKWT